MAVIDASDAPIGRLATRLAKRLLEGEEINVVNAEKAIITGNKDEIKERYLSRKRRGGTKRKGPYFPRLPHLILKRTVRGMLPMKKSRGKEAYKRLKVYMGVPKEYQSAPLEKIEEAKNNKLEGFITLKELSIQLGAKLR